MRREAFTGGRVDQQLDEQMRQWLAEPELNRFARDKIQLSPLFDWYASHFESAEGGTRGVLRKYAPPEAAPVVEDETIPVSYLSYDWGLNDSGDLGASYTKTDRILDEVRKRL